MLSIIEQRGRFEIVALAAPTSPRTMREMRPPRRGLFQRPSRSGLPAICLLTATFALSLGITIAREGSKPVGRTGK
jgi:hypothetical protein